MPKYGLRSTYDRVLCNERSEEFTCENHVEANRLRISINADIDALESQLRDERALTMFVRNELAAANATLDKLKALETENVDLQWKAKESEIAMLEAQQSEDYWKSQSEDANATLDKLREVVPTDRVQCTKCPSILDTYYLGCGEFKCEDCEKDFSLFDLIDKLRAILYPTETPNEHE